ncbi:MAG: glutamine--tRNA ligase/YqeY domain fusion protein [Acidobacteria bacterium]|nr:glutamine--tRNA ligase/YqeY domain fusion protein [Acidobacteriota bacterium]
MTEATGANFIQEAVQEDLAKGRFSKVITRFPPEPNGYLHIGHAKAICIDFGIAEEFGGVCNLRFDDTNPTKEEQHYIDAIQDNVRWLGFDWGDRLYYASDYFDRMYAWAIQLIKDGKAYVDDQTPDEIRENRGTLTEPGRPSPYRDRSIEENLDLFERMQAGEFPDGSRVLRAKIDMAAPNLNLRDPVMYRILAVPHHRTGNRWKIYPMYDWAHGLEDSVEGISHSLCSLEFEDHRPLYDWYLEQLGIHHPRQIEFARLELEYTVLSKRKLIQLVEGGYVTGWDDPRLPTLAGLRRRGYTPAAIRNFCDRIGVSKAHSVVEFALLEHCLREELNKSAPRTMAVLRPLKVVLTNYPEGKVEEFEADINPEDPSAGKRKIPFSRELWIEQDDFREDPPKKFFRLSPGREVRLKYAYYITCNEVIKDPDTGDLIELRCKYDPETRGGWLPGGRKVKGTSHWVSAPHAVRAEFRLYDRLFTKPNPDEGKQFLSNLNAQSLESISGFIEAGLENAPAGNRYQFERQGYFSVDPVSKPGAMAFNRSVSLKDTWAKIENKKNNKNG